MKQVNIFIACIFFALSNVAQTQGWINGGGGAESDESYGVTVDEEGNIYLAGSIDSAGTIEDIIYESGGSEIVFVTKYSPDGDVVWNRSFFQSNTIAFSSQVEYADGNVYVAVNVNGTIEVDSEIYSTAGYDIILIKLDTDGNVLWSKQFGGTSIDYVFGMAHDNDGNVLLTGRFSENSVFDDFDLSTTLVNPKTFLTKINAAGEVLWAIQDQSEVINSTSRAWGIATDADNNIYAGGYYGKKINFGAEEAVNTLSDISLSPYIAKFNSAGTCEWITALEGTVAFVSVYVITTDDAGNVYFSCPGPTAPGEVLVYGSEEFEYGECGFLISKLNANTGNKIWAKPTALSIENSGQWATGIHIINDDSIYIVGQALDNAVFDDSVFNSTGYLDVFYLLMNAESAIYNIHSLQGNYNEISYASALDDENNLIIAGYMNSNVIYFGGDSIVNVVQSDTVLNTSDIFLAKINYKDTVAVPDGIVDDVSGYVLLYPNPVFDRLHFSAGVELNALIEIFIYNAEGKLIKYKSTINNPENYLDVSMLPAGNFLIEIKASGKSIFQKFTKL